jgi:uncharacterized protein (DUF1330 family)
MKAYYKLTLAMLASAGIGAIAMDQLHAQSKPPVYYIAEIEVTDLDGYTKEFATKAQAIYKAAGAKYLAAGQKVTALEGGEAPKRVVIQQWDSLEKMQAVRETAEFKEMRKLGEKYAKFRSFAVEGLPQ